MYGCLQNPAPDESAENCLGNGTMPAQILTGQAADNVSKFVAAVAGKE
jgi:hypothetical protein